MGDQPRSDLAAKLGELVANEMHAVIKKTDGATVNLLESIDSSLSDLVEVLEKNGGDAIARAIIQAIKEMKFPQSGGATPNIVVQPAEVNMPAPVVHVQQNTNAVFDIKFEYGENGRLMGMKVARSAKANN